MNLDNNLDNKDLNKIEILIIHILLLLLVTLNNMKSEVFFTLLSFVEKGKKMAIILTNRLFSYPLFIINKILPNSIYNTIDLELFTYITTN